MNVDSNNNYGWADYLTNRFKNRLIDFLFRNDRLIKVWIKKLKDRLIQNIDYLIEKSAIEKLIYRIDYSNKENCLKNSLYWKTILKKSNTYMKKINYIEKIQYIVIFFRIHIRFCFSILDFFQHIEVFSIYWKKSKYISFLFLNSSCIIIS